MLLSTLGTVLSVALLIALAWALLRWLIPYIIPLLADIFDLEPAEEPSALEILRQRYAAGEIDAVTFEQMRERLEASYHQGEQRPPRE
jgi:putative membrane protein